MIRCKLFIKGFICLLCICLYCLQSSASADTIDYNLKFYGYSSHFEKDWFFHPGFQVDRDLYITNWLIVRSSMAVYRDSGHLVAGFFHCGFRINARKFHRFYIRVGVGPTLVWRQNWWVHKDDYNGTSFYGDQYHSDRFEKNFLPYGGDVEIEWVIKPNISVLFATIPGYPVIFANSLGIRF